MKLRNGFVSNSSSSSFVVLLPRGFDISTLPYEKVVLDYEGPVRDDQGNTIEDPTDEQVTAEIKKDVAEFIGRGSCYEYDYPDFVGVARTLFEEYIVAEMSTGSDEGQMALADQKKVSRILGLEDGAA